MANRKRIPGGRAKQTHSWHVKKPILVIKFPDGTTMKSIHDYVVELRDNTDLRNDYHLLLTRTAEPHIQYELLKARKVSKRTLGTLYKKLDKVFESWQ